MQEKCLNNIHWSFVSYSLKDGIMKAFIFNSFISVLFLTSMYHFISMYTFFFLCLFVFSTAYGGSQARGLIGAVATGLCQSHNNTGSEPCPQPTPQPTATPDPQPTQQDQGLKLKPHGSRSDSLTTEPRWELPNIGDF